MACRSMPDSVTHVVGLICHLSRRSAPNVSTPGVRCKPGRHAARRRPARGRSRRPYPDDPAGVAVRTPAPGSRLPLPRLPLYASARGITSVIGRPAARRRSRISRCSVGGITAACTRRAIRSPDSPPARWSFGDLTGECYPKSGTDSTSTREQRLGGAEST